MRKNPGKYLLICMLIVTAGAPMLMGQITSSSADHVRDLTYKVHPDTSKLFVFYQTHQTKAGALRADFESIVNLDIVWTKYDPDADAFSIEVKSESGVDFSEIRDLDEGAYRVDITGTSVDTFFIAWVMLDNFKVSLVKDALGQVPHGDSQCPQDLNWLILRGVVELDNSFHYFDLQTHDTLRVSNDFRVEWTSDNTELQIANQYNKNAVGLNYAEGYNHEDSPYIPYEDTWYILTAWDSLGMEEVDSVFYDTKFTKAEFTVEYWDKVIAEEKPLEAWDPDLNTEISSADGKLTKGSRDAPLTVRYLNESLNGYEYEWVFVDSISDEGIINKENEFSSDKEYMPEFTYYRADKYYYPYLVSISDATCRDTFFMSDGIEVVASQLNIPNVFTPNGDEKNDHFVFQHQSIQSFKITISDRYGRVVYRHKSENIYEWEGWRGTILNGNTEAPEGQYYFVIEALGYDNVEYRDMNFIEQWNANRQSGNGGTTTPNAGPDGEGTTQSTNLYTGFVYLFRNTFAR